MVRTLHARLLTLGGVALTTALSGLLLWPSAVYAFGGKYHIGEAGFSNIHKSITYTAFWFMDRRMTSAMAVANHHQDNHEIYGDDCSHHSCNCQFRQASNWYNSQYRAVIDLLKEPLKPSTDTYPAYYFGMALHGIQDFYAHANWVPKYPNGLAIDFKLIDEGVGEWPLFEPYKVFNEKLMIIQGDPPADVKVRLPVNSIGKVISAVPVIEDRRMYLSPAPPAHVPLPPIIAGEFQRAPTADGIRAEESAATVTAEPGERSVSEGGGSPTRERPPTAQVRKYYGVMTAGSLVAESGRSYFPEQQCHPVGSNCKEDSDRDVCLRHGESRDATSQYAFEGDGHMNWDYGGEGDWKRARDMATRQTTHEWCRLLNLSRTRDPSLQATGRLLTMWVAPDKSPHPVGDFVCHKESRRSHTVRVTVSPSRAEVGGTPVVMSRSDFTDSKRALAYTNRSATLEFCANTTDRVLVSVIPPYARGAGTEFAMPTATRSWTIEDSSGAWPVKYEVKVTEGCRQ